MTKLNWQREKDKRNAQPILPPESDYYPYATRNPKATPRQRQYIFMLLRQRGLLTEAHGKNVPNLTISQASSFIRQLKQTRALPVQSRACPNERVLPNTVLPPNHRSNPAPDENAGL